MVSFSHGLRFGVSAALGFRVCLCPFRGRDFEIAKRKALTTPWGGSWGLG